MQSVPSKGILDRDVSTAASEEIRAVGRPALREVIDEGIRVFERCSATASGKDEHLGFLFPFLHLIELLDAAELSLDGASTTGGNLILRGAFEASLAVEWISKDKNLRYGAAYVVADIHRRIAAHERYSEGHEARKQFMSALASDPMSKDIELPKMADAPERIAGFRQLLQEDHLRDAAAEYDATRKRVGRRPHFFSLWNGPDSVQQLALRLKRSGQYEILYRSWSLTQHTSDVARQLGSSDGKPAVRAFRDGEGLTTAYVFALTFGCSAIHSVLEFYRFAELADSFPKWYAAHVADAMKRLTEAE